MDFKDRVAIITGSARGIGAATCWAFAKRGATAVVVDINGEGAMKVAADIQAKGFSAVAYTADVSDREAVEDLVEDVFKKFGRIDILVNNAYISGGYAIVTETSQETWDKVIAVNLTGAFHFAKAVAKKMIPQKYGKIINISSGAGTSGSLSSGV
ncbi:MAG: SDR family NAD(P)-dependent oxidoreductase, partial [Candidatus Thorarchaeota archaeon]